MKNQKIGSRIGVKFTISSFSDLAGNSVLLSLTLQVLGGYQKLSPDIFTQVNFNPAKLLPSLLSHDSDKESCDPDILVLVLQLNLNVCNGRSWNQVRI